MYNKVKSVRYYICALRISFYKFRYRLLYLRFAGSNQELFVDQEASAERLAVLSSTLEDKLTAAGKRRKGIFPDFGVRTF